MRHQMKFRSTMIRKCFFLFYFKSYFHSNFKIWESSFLWLIKYLSIKQEIHFTYNLGSKHSLVIKLDQVLQYCTKKKKFIKNLYKKFDLETSSRSFRVYKELSRISVGKWNFETSWLNYICNIKTTKIFQNLFSDFLSLLTDDFLRIKRDLQLVLRLQCL